MNSKNLKLLIGVWAVIMMQIHPLVTQAQEQVVSLTLEESIKYALENNVEAKNAQLEVLAAKGTIGENLARGLPQINGSFEFTHNMAIPIMFVPNEPPFGDPSIDSEVLPVRLGVDFQSTLGVRLEQMIFDGSYFVGLKAAKTLRMLTEYDKEKIENDVIENIKKAYFTVLVNRERMILVEANLSRVENLLKETTALNKEGFAEKLEVSRVKVQLNNLKTEYDKIVTATAISVELLKLQIGIPYGVEIDISETLNDHNQADYINEILQNNGYRRVEIDQAKTNLELAKLDLKNNQVQYIPTINGFLAYQRSGAALDFDRAFNSSNWFSAAFVGLNMSIPIFDGFLKKNKIQKNRIQIRQLENQISFLDQNIDVEIFQSKKNLVNSLETLKVQEENRELALEVFEMTKIKYQEGVGSNLEVVEADSALKEAETNYFSALYDALIAKVELEKALGVL
ncbi:TolC family protein [Belliella sp. DSM 111904]|uniref:TolC family protein n=1 Tax=Belliella filtrata TaxID=2923435 RepID=A0ABS9UZJ3_9BACT|nr:TolC family protein [Belliella filtrata]MCH7409389.1 TolC family protein [Belliella filtrata]